MKTQKVENLNQWFTAYVRGFYTNGADEFIDTHIRLKEDHTDRVCREMRILTEALELNAQDANLAQAAARLHDVGRFEQLQKYRTYADPKSVDHGRLGREIIDRQAILDDIDPAERDILRTAVRWHGAKALPEDLDERTAFFCKLIRDADKLDVLALLIQNFERYYADPKTFPLEVEFPDAPRVSEHVVRAVMNRQLVDYARIQTLHDAQLVLLGWVFDINFLPALKRIAENRYLEQIAGLLPDLPEARQAADYVINYVKSKLQPENK